jgi:hypothetical protein
MYEITHDEKIGYLSALAISWLYGGNRLGVKMIGENGEGFEGIEYMHYNRNSGAESTICSLRTLLYGMKLPEKYLEIAIMPSILARTGLIVLEEELFDTGITSARTVAGDYGAGASVQIDGTGRIKRTDLESGVYYALVAGLFQDTTLTVSGSEAIKKQLEGVACSKLEK